MITINKVLIAGNIVREPEVKNAGNSLVCNFRVAINKKLKSGNDIKDIVTYVDVSAWSKQAEYCRDYAHKGSNVIVEGTLRTEDWVDSQGQKRTKLCVVGERTQVVRNTQNNQDNWN